MGMLKGAFRLLMAIIFSPEQTWHELSKTKEDGQFLEKNYLYPIFFLIALTSMIGVFLGALEHNFQIAIKEMILSLMVFGGGYFISSFFLNEYLASFFPDQKNLTQSRQFVAYASSPSYLLCMMVALLNDLFFLWVFVLYTVYLVYLGSFEFIKIEESRRGQFVTVASLFILVVPYFIKFILEHIINKA